MQGGTLAVRSQVLIVHNFLWNGGTRYGPSSSRLRHNDRGDPSSDTASSREPKEPFQALWDRYQDRREVEETQLRHRSADRPQSCESTVLSVEAEAIVVAFRRHTLLPLDD
jgi:hypothetical protein